MTDGKLASGDVLSVTVSGSQTDAGSSANTIVDYEIKHGDQDVTANYNVTTKDGTLTVGKRSVTLQSGSAVKTYDGTPLTNGSVTVGGDGFVTGEGASYTVTGSQTSVGSSPNTFTYALYGNTKAGNYNVSSAEGILTVNAAPKDTKSPVLKSVSGSQKKGTYLVNLKVKASDNVGVTGYALTYVNPKTKKKVSLNLTGTTFTVAENCVGTLKCTLKAVDAAGNKSSAKSFTVKIKDYTAPAWKSSAKSSVSAVTQQKGGTLKWSGATDNVKVTKYTVKVLNSSGKTVKSYSTASSSVKLSGIKAGVNFSYKITAKDAAGNTGKTALTGQFGVGDVSNNTYKTASKLKKNKSIAAVLNSADKLDFYSFSGASSLDLEIDTGSVKATFLNAKGKKVGSVITLQQGSTYNWDLASYGTARYLKLESKNAQYLLASKA